jgi:hypothetical protein
MRRSGFIACLGCATGAVTLALVNADDPHAGGTIAAAQTTTCRVRLLVLVRWSFSFATRGRGARLITNVSTPDGEAAS